MKPVCPLLLLLFVLPLAACQSHSTLSEKAFPKSATLLAFNAPATLGDWHLQGSISQGERLHVLRYQQTSPQQALDVSLYPLPEGWQEFSPEQALTRHFGMLTQQLATTARDKYGATRVEVADAHIDQQDASGLPVINSRFTSHFANNTTRVTLVSLTLYQGNFIRLTLTCPPERADALTAALANARQALIDALRKQGTHPATHG